MVISGNINGMVRLSSAHSFADTLERLEAALKSKGLTVFARIDFSGDAGKAGLKMNPARLLIFGNPRAGTPLMVASPSIAIDFPLKILVSEEAGKVWVSYNTPEYLKKCHHVPDDLVKNIADVVAITESIAG